jgi:hypothetical protein
MLGLGLSATADDHKATIITFDAPGAGSTAAGQGTYSYGINTPGAVTGWYIDGGWVWHGFLRAPDGSITTFDAPGAGTSAYLGTVPYSINTEGAITGFYIDSGIAVHGFLRKP